MTLFEDALLLGRIVGAGALLGVGLGLLMLGVDALARAARAKDSRPHYELRGVAVYKVEAEVEEEMEMDTAPLLGLPNVWTRPLNDKEVMATSAPPQAGPSPAQETPVQAYDRWNVSDVCNPAQLGFAGFYRTGDLDLSRRHPLVADRIRQFRAQGGQNRQNEKGA